MYQKQYGGSLGGPIAQRPDVLLRERRAAPAGSDRPGDDLGRRTSPSINARLAAVGYPGARVTTGIYPNPVHSDERARQDRSPVQRQRSLRVRYSLYDVDVEQLARRRRAQRAVGVGRSGQQRSDAGVQQHLDAVAEHGQRDARAVCPRRSAGAADRSHRACRQHRGRGVVRHVRQAARPAG